MLNQEKEINDRSLTSRRNLRVKNVRLPVKRKDVSCLKGKTFYVFGSGTRNKPT